jgi:ferritin-like metal-binding protein YciE
MPTKKEKTLNDLFEDALKDIYYAEKKILTALSKMAKATATDNLAAAFEKHRGETEQQVARLERVFEILDQPPKGKKCPGIEGILKEGKEIMEEFKGMPALDAGLLAAAQAVEHYEITRYGTLIAWAEKLGLKDATPLLQENLDEEKATDETLTELAETAINQYAQAAE